MLVCVCVCMCVCVCVCVCVCMCVCACVCVCVGSYLSTEQSLTVAPSIAVVTLLMTSSNCCTILLIVSVGVASDNYRKVNRHKTQQVFNEIAHFPINKLQHHATNSVPIFP